MIRSIEFDIVTKSEANMRFASKAGMFAKSHRVQKQRAAVRDVLAAHHTAPRLHVDTGGGMAVNRITVKLTRIAPGELDDDNLRGALKAVRDAIAAWIGTNDRDPLLSWDYGQERAGQHVYRVRVTINDLAPGEPRRVVLAETASEGRAAKGRVKRLTTKAAKGATNVQTKTTPTTPEAFRAASHRRLRDGDDGTVRRNGTLQAVTSSGRAAAEAAWSKATKPAERLVHAAVAGYGPGVQNEAEALAAMNEQARSVQCPVPACAACRLAEPPNAWPVCISTHDGEPFEYGVHASRARAAGLPPYPSVAELNAGLRPVRVERPCPFPVKSHVTRDSMGIVKCNLCDGSGKVAAWEWQSKSPGRKPAASEGASVKNPEKQPRRTLEERPHRDPGEERPARDLAPCTSCGVAVGLPCIDVPGAPGLRRVHGVHVARARAAGLYVPDDDRRHVQPARGPRRVVPAAGQRPLPLLQAWAALPWAEMHVQTTCGLEVGQHEPGQCAAHGCDHEDTKRVRKLTRWMLQDGIDPDMTVRMRVPPQHVSQHGTTITLTRTRGTVPGVGEAWIYETER